MSSLNPHVVGRFFRAVFGGGLGTGTYVLIPMWWGGFSESDVGQAIMIAYAVLIPMWWGGFSEKKRAEAIREALSLNPHVVGRFFRG